MFSEIYYVQVYINILKMHIHCYVLYVAGRLQVLQDDHIYKIAPLQIHVDNSDCIGLTTSTLLTPPVQSKFSYIFVYSSSQYRQLIVLLCFAGVDTYGEDTVQYSPASQQEGEEPSPHSRTATPLECLSYAEPEPDSYSAASMRTEGEFILFNRLDDVSYFN